MKKYRYLFLFLSAFITTGDLFAQLTAGFTASPTSGCVPLVVSFTNTTTPSSGTSYHWDFGPGSWSSLTNPSTSFTTPGTHVVTLTATNGASVSTSTMTITVYPPPTASFTVSDSAVCPGTAVSFTNTSIGGVPGPMTCKWSFGDGTPMVLGTPVSHTYAAPGFYTVTLFVTNSEGCESSVSVPAVVHVFNPPVPNFTWGPFAICNPPGTVTFSNSTSGTGPLTYAWTFGDGGTSTASGPSHLYSTPGAYSPTLIATDAHGCKDTVSLGPIIVDTPRAEFSFDTTICLWAYTTFTNTSSPHVSRTWNYGDGSPTTTLLNGTHHYTSTGTYVVTLTISNPPCTETITHTVNVVTGPTASITPTPDEPCPAPVSVSYSASGPAGTTYDWLIDGGPASGSSVTHGYTSCGAKFIRLISTDPVTGCKDTLEQRDTVRDIIFHANATPQEGCAPLTVNFDHNIYTSCPTAGPYPYPISSFSWDFGDGSPLGSGGSPSHTYTAVGVYIASVTATTANGCVTGDTVRIRVGKPPVATFTASPLHLCYGAHDSVTFTPVIVTGPVDEWDWLFGDDGTTVWSSFASPVNHTYSIPGLFTVTLTPSYLGCPGDPYILTDYVLIDSPKSIIRDSFYCYPRTRVQFYNESMGDDSHMWFFSDGTSSTADDPLHDFPALGSYTVMLTTYNIASGCRDTQVANISLVPPIFDFTASSTAICKYDTILFTVSVTSGTLGGYRWSYADGSGYFHDTLAGPAIMDTFLTRGLHTIRLIATDEYGCLDTLTKTNYVTVGKPIPDFTATPMEGCKPLSVLFTDVSSPASGTSMSSYIWDFGDGSSSTVSTPTVTHIYTAGGTYDVNEIAIDNIGCRDTILHPSMITVYDPIAAFSASTPYPCIGAPMSFASTSSGTIASYSWNFGDGGTATGPTPSHTYSSIGTYNVSLTVTDTHGCTDTHTSPALIHVTKPNAGFTMSDSVSVCPPLFVMFNNTSTGASSYSWDLGDGTSSVVFSPSDMYITSGLFNVVLVATNEHGCTDTAYHSVNIFGYAGAFSYTPTQGCAPLAVHFSASLTNVPTITWDFSDGTTVATSHNDTAVHIYTVPGAYLPKLILSDNTGCQTSSLGADTIKVDAVNVKFKTDPNPVCPGVPFSFIDSSWTYWSPVTSILWTIDGDTTSVSSPTDTIYVPGSYPVTLEVTNGWGCVGTATSDLVVVPPPVISASPDTTVCTGDPAVLYGYGAVNYTWSPSATLSCATCNPTDATPTVETTYTVVGADANGCLDTAEVTVHLKTHITSVAWGDTAVCYGVPVQLNDTGGKTYQWIPSTGLSNSNISDPVATPPYTTIYTVVATEGSCIPDTNFVTVFIYPLPTVDAGPDQRVLAGSTAQIHAKGTDVATWAWLPNETLSCPDCPDPVASMSVSTTYNVDVTSPNGCKASDSVRILVFCDESMVFIPNAFTPNGDGENDVFYPRGQGVKIIKTFRIYNRWGEMLFERTNINLNDATNAWDGSYKGATPRPDVYVYIMEAVCYTGEDVMVKGDVTIIR